MSNSERRREESQGLDKEGVAQEPLEQFDRWMGDAREAGEPQANAMVLATAGKNARPSARVVILRDASEQGFVFYANYESQKGRDLAENPWASLVSFWPRCGRQVRVEGSVEKVPSEESDAFFRSRHREAQLEAWAFPQSQVVASREELERRWQEYESKLGSGMSRPPWWGGYRLLPVMVEFWEERPHRLHDRLRYRRRQDGGWSVERLAP